MTFKIILVTCFLAALQPAYSNSASFITKCSLTDKKCLKSSTQAAIPIFAAGIPELGIKLLDPLKIKSLDASSPNLKLKLKDIVATGLSQCVAREVEFTADLSKLKIKLLCTVDAKGKYEMDGKLLILPVKGNGDAHVVLNKILISAILDMSDVKGADGQTHWKITKWEHTYELEDKSTVELENLFDGNEVLGRAAGDLIKEQPNEIIHELGPTIVQYVIAKIVKEVNHFFEKIAKSALVA